MQTPPDFAAFILSHGRPEKAITHRSLRRHGYTGPIYVVIDDEDPTEDAYRERYGEEVMRFPKSEVAKTFDTGDASTDRRASVFGRHAVAGFARDFGLTHYTLLDDDYTTFIYRLRGPGPNSRFGVSFGSSPVRSLDAVFAAMVRFLDDTGAVTVAMSQGGDHIGGVGSTSLRQGFKRKAMNTFVIRTDRPVPFVGRMNEDVNAYCLDGSRGGLYFTVSNLQIEQMATQQNAGGMSEAYLDSGTYVKSFFTVMMCPSFVDIRSMGRTDRRLHHRVSWPHAVPKIVGPEVRKA